MLIPQSQAASKGSWTVFHFICVELIRLRQFYSCLLRCYPNYLKSEMSFHGHVQYFIDKCEMAVILFVERKNARDSKTSLFLVDSMFVEEFFL